VLADILGQGNEASHLPGQVEAEAAARSEANHGLLFTAAEINELNQLAAEVKRPALQASALPVAT